MDQATQIGLDEDPVEIALGEKLEQRLDALGWRRARVQEQHVLPMQAAGAAADVIANLADQTFLAYGNPRLLCKLFQSLKEELRGRVFAVALGFALLHRLEISSDADRDCKGNGRDSRRGSRENASAFRTTAALAMTPVRLVMRPLVLLVLLVLLVFLVFLVLAAAPIAVLVRAARGMPALGLFVLGVGMAFAFRLLTQARDRFFERLEAVRDALELAANRRVRAQLVERRPGGFS
jgi:hypothetical protein